MIALVTDSNAMFPPELADRYGVEVVPLTVRVDGVDHLEGVDLDADGFYARFAGGTPAVSTSQPSPGRFAAAYAAVAERGADAILSIHIGSSLSGTVNSARLAAADAPIPVRVVDTGTASFAIACCVWEAGEALAAGATIEQAAAVAEDVGATVGNVFVVGALDLARAGGRLAAEAVQGPSGPRSGEHGSTSAIPVLTLAGGAMRAVDQVDDMAQAADAMADHVRSSGTSLRVGVGLADAGALPLVTALEERLAGAAEVRELVRYRIGPSVGAHTGPGTVGAMYYPTG